MGQPKISISSERRDYDKYFKIDEAEITEVDENGESTSYKRYALVRPDAVAIMVYNYDEDSVILVKQHRYPVQVREKNVKSGFENDFIYEIPAGKIDGGENPLEASIREVKEEIGYEIKDGKLIHMSSFYASPGYSSEMVHLFCATVKNEDKTSSGGGVEGEHENIDIHSIPVSDFFNMIKKGEIVDAKTILGSNALWHLRNDDLMRRGLECLEKQRTEDAIKTADKVINEEGTEGE